MLRLILLFLLGSSSVLAQTKEPVLYVSEDSLEFLLFQYLDSTDTRVKMIYINEGQWTYTEGDLVDDGGLSYEFVNYYDLRVLNLSVDSVPSVDETFYFYFPPVNYHELFMKYSVSIKSNCANTLEFKGPIIELGRELFDQCDTLQIKLKYIDVDDVVLPMPRTRFYSYYFRISIPVDLDHYFVPYDLSLQFQAERLILSEAVMDGGGTCFNKFGDISAPELLVILNAL